MHTCIRRVRIALTGATTSHEDLRRRFCCGQQQDHIGHRTRGPSSQQYTRPQLVSHRIQLGQTAINHERLEELKKHGETCWSQDGYIILDDTINEKAGD